MFTSDLISARGLARSFKTRKGRVEAVRPLNFDVAAGEIVGLLGPNGAGKTTTLRMLTTLLEPSSGSARVVGHDLSRDPRAVRRGIGYVAQVGSAPAAGTLLGEELITQARLQGLSKPEAGRRLAEVAPRLDLAGLEGRSLMQLSGGQRRRFDIALGLMHAPRLVFLDEPTTGLDPQSRANLWDHLRSLRDETGVTILLTTHYLEEADALADRILVMDDGRLIADDTPAALKARVAGDVIALGFERGVERAVQVTRQTLEPRAIKVTERALQITVEEGAVAVAPLLRALDAAGLQPSSVTVSRPSLDDVFLTLTGRSLREETTAPPAVPEPTYA
ncbi:MAG: ATP-binding cassette domain-containing protein [Solirubrobacteraceae bacterium]